MTIISSTIPANNNVYQLVISDNKHLVYDIQSFDVSGVSIGKIATPYMNNEIYLPDNVLHVDDLNLTLLLSENFVSYVYLLKWLFDSKEQINDYRKTVAINIYDPNFKKIGHIVYSGVWLYNIGSFNSTSADIDSGVQNIPISLSVDGILDIDI